MNSSLSISLNVQIPIANKQKVDSVLESLHSAMAEVATVDGLDASISIHHIQIEDDG